MFIEMLENTIEYAAAETFVLTTDRLVIRCESSSGSLMKFKITMKYNTEGKSDCIFLLYYHATTISIDNQFIMFYSEEKNKQILN